MRRLAKGMLGAAALVAIAGAGIATPFVAASMASDWEVERRSIPEYHNAVKHAFAAAELYSKARWVVGDQSAAWLVNGLGEITERVEQYVKHDRDVSPEVYKDLRNNVYGIVAARWLRENFDHADATTLLRLIGWLAKHDELPAHYDDPRLPKLPIRPDAETAIQLMRADEHGLSENFTATLDRNRDAIAVDLGLVSR